MSTIRETLSGLGYICLKTFEDAEPTPYFLLYRLPNRIILFGNVVFNNLIWPWLIYPLVYVIYYMPRIAQVIMPTLYRVANGEEP